MISFPFSSSNLKCKVYTGSLDKKGRKIGFIGLQLAVLLTTSMPHNSCEGWPSISLKVPLSSSQ